MISRGRLSLAFLFGTLLTADVSTLAAEETERPAADVTQSVYLSPMGDPTVDRRPPADQQNVYVPPPEPLTAPQAEPWTWQTLPDGLLYKSYLAGNREPRLGTVFAYDKTQRWLWDSALGGRVGIMRFGTHDPLWPEGWQLDVEGAAFPRLDLQDQRELEAVDFRAGIPLTYRSGPWEQKFAYYHLCSHIGDQFLEENPDFVRNNYSRDCLLWGVGYHPSPDWRLYGEIGYAFHTTGGKPWELQFGAEYSPLRVSSAGSPFVAVNGHLRQEVDYGGNVVVQAGWQWRRGQRAFVSRRPATPRRHVRFVRVPPPERRADRRRDLVRLLAARRKKAGPLGFGCHCWLVQRCFSKRCSTHCWASQQWHPFSTGC